MIKIQIHKKDILQVYKDGIYLFDIENPKIEVSQEIAETTKYSEREKRHIVKTTVAEQGKPKVCLSGNLANKTLDFMIKGD